MIVRRPWTTKEQHAIAEMYRLGCTLPTIAAAVGRTPGAVGAQLHRSRIVRVARVTPRERYRVGLLARAGRSDGEIAKKLNRTIRTVWKIRNELGLPPTNSPWDARKRGQLS